MISSRPVPIITGLFGTTGPTKAYDLSSGWWPGMPVAEAHPPLQVTTYRTPYGMRADGMLPVSGPANTKNYGFISEVVSTTMHAGTHIDALCHVTDGKDDSWYGDHSACDYLGDFGALREDASELPVFLNRGVLLDIPRALGVRQLFPGQQVGPSEMEASCKRQDVSLSPGDVVLIRTGFMQTWPDRVAMSAAKQPGLSLAGAQWLRQFSPTLIGADNTSLEVYPSGIAGEPQPVHRYLIRQHGVPILEWAYLEELASDQVSQFIFLAVPLTIRGATGSLVRPLALR